MACMSAVHLGVVELERDRERCFKQSAAVSAPYHKRIVVNAAVHPHGSIKLRVDNGGCPDDHFVVYIVILAAFGGLRRQVEIVTLTSLYPPE